MIKTNEKCIKYSKFVYIVLIELGFAEIFPVWLQLSVLMTLNYLLGDETKPGIVANTRCSLH